MTSVLARTVTFPTRVVPALAPPARATRPVTLAEAARGTDVRVVTVAACPQRRRLAELGIRPGAVVRPLTRNAGGGCTLLIGTSRIALDRTVLALVGIAPA